MGVRIPYGAPFQVKTRRDFTTLCAKNCMGESTMHLSRVVIKGYRALGNVDVAIAEKATCVIGENNTGKSCFVQALRLCLDVDFSSAFRSLQKDDIHSDIDQTAPFQVLVGVEFTGYQASDNEVAMLHGTQLGDGRARIFYRFRPKTVVREALSSGERAPDSLTLDDFGWELFGGGNPAVDLADSNGTPTTMKSALGRLACNICRLTGSFSSTPCATSRAILPKCVDPH
ncbi:AAA family ATPase [Mesorhizobium sp.]|uniref:AAA family ATPase n=1 Tax=Mesorhizobium sp. TaxID=1871066 RepID=UPI0025DEEF97|nr:AAA family ATPase [Mesorhizobium sp.]